jgi:cysteine-rich repeat protein
MDVKKFLFVICLVMLFSFTVSSSNHVAGSPYSSCTRDSDCSGNSICGAVPEGTGFYDVNVATPNIQRPAGRYCLPQISYAQYADVGNRNLVEGITGQRYVARCYIDEQCQGGIGRVDNNARDSTFGAGYLNGGICRESDIRRGEKYCYSRILTSSTSNVVCGYNEQCGDRFQESICNNNQCRVLNVASDRLPTITLYSGGTNLDGLSTVRWFTVGTRSCTGNGGANRFVSNSANVEPWAGAREVSGVFYTRLNAVTTFTLSCTNNLGTTTQSVTVDPTVMDINPYREFKFENINRIDVSRTGAGTFSNVYSSTGVRDSDQRGGSAEGFDQFATYVGEAYLVDSALGGKAINLNGGYITNRFMKRANNNYFRYTNSFPDGYTISFWVKPDSLVAGTEGIFQWARENNPEANPGAPDSFEQGSDAAVRDSVLTPFILIRRVGPNLQYFIDGAYQTLPTNAQLVNGWNHIALTRERVLTVSDVPHQTRLMLNGEVINSYLGDSILGRIDVLRQSSLQERSRNTNVNNAHHLYFGTAFGGRFNGQIDEVQLFKEGLSGEAVRNIYGRYVTVLGNAAIAGTIQTIDRDGDGITDNLDNCPNNFNPGQEDNNGFQDNSGLGDACEVRAGGVPDGIASSGSSIPEGAGTGALGQSCNPGGSCDTSDLECAVGFTCLLRDTRCGNGVLENLPILGIIEACDDGNQISGDGCSNLCRIEVVEVCGDGILDDLTESCDDSNLVDGDGCSGTCQIEDFDNDGIVDNLDNCPTVVNPDQMDSDSDGSGDACLIVLPAATVRDIIQAIQGNSMINCIFETIEAVKNNLPVPICN